MGGGGRRIFNYFKSNRRARVGVALLFGGAAVGSLYFLRGNLYTSIPSGGKTVENKDKQVIYVEDPDENSSYLKKHFSRWWPVSLLGRPIAWHMFENFRKSIHQMNEDTLETFAKVSSFLESECNHISMCVDLRTAIALARAGADPRLFIGPRLIPKDNKDYYGNKFRHLFLNLPNGNIHPTLDSLILTALKMYHPTEKEQEDRSLDYYSGFESDFHLSQNPVKDMGEKEFLKICLLGVVSHSRIYKSIKQLLSLDILDLLVVITREYHDDVDLISLVLRVLANISCDISSAQLIRDTGCLKILAESAVSSNIKLVLPAKRALHNLDRRETNLAPVLPSGVYQLYPEFGCDDCMHQYDVVFIHGLLGGVFRTWRRHDVNPNEDREKDEYETRMSVWKSRLTDLRSKSPMLYNPTPAINPDKKVQYPTRRYTGDGELHSEFEELPIEIEDQPSTPTQCWPRDWLPDDCPDCRVIGVDFESFVSRWMTICPIETSERKLKDRSADLLKKLQEVGIGKRPVVWVAHSMGGLILKSLLVQAAESDDEEQRKICSNTKGVVFCSVPHRGTDMAILNTARRWLLLPTEEIEELSDEDKQLTILNERFLRLYEKYNFKLLSFGEVLETRTGLGMKFKLVPFSSSDIGVGEYYPLRLDHLGTCKPWSRGSFIYIKTVQFIKELSPKANLVNLPPEEAEASEDIVVPGFEFSFREPITNFILWLSSIFLTKEYKDDEEKETKQGSSNNNDNDPKDSSQVNQLNPNSK